MKEEVNNTIRELRDYGESLGTIQSELSGFTEEDGIEYLGYPSAVKVVGYSKVGKQKIYSDEEPMPDELFNALTHVQKMLYIVRGVTNDEDELVAFFTADKVTDISRDKMFDLFDKHGGGIHFLKLGNDRIILGVDGRTM